MAEIRFELDMDLHQRFKMMCVQEHETMVGVVRDLIEGWVDVKEKGASVKGGFATRELNPNE